MPNKIERIIDNDQFKTKINNENDNKTNADIDYLVNMYSKISKDLLIARYKINQAE